MTIRICCVAPNIFGFTGGIQIYTQNLLKALTTLLPDAHVITLLKYDRNSNIEHFPTSIPGVSFVCFGCWPRQIQTLAMTISIFFLALRYPNMLFIATHVNYAKALYLTNRLINIRYWVVAHGIEVWDVRSRILIQALKTANRVIAVSQYTRQRLIQKQGLPKQQVLVLPNTFHKNRFTVKPKSLSLLEKHHLRDDQKVILTVCRLGKTGTYKGYEQIIRALPLVQQKIPDIHYIIVGKGDDTDRINRLILSLGMEKNVTLTGFVPDKKLPDYYNLCDVFAMPSKGEGFGIVYLEALASGKPVLAGNQDGAVDPLLGGKLGCLVNPCNRNEIATSLVQILQGRYFNQNIYRPEFLRQAVISRFSQTQFQTQLASLLNCYISNTQP